MRTNTRYNKYQKSYSKPVQQPAVRIQRDWSEYQKAIFKDIETSKENTHVEAVAGSGKTSTIVEGFYYVPSGRKSLMCAFNKSIQTELSARAPQSVEPLTLHSLGYRACRAAYPRLGQPDNDKLPGYVKAEFGDNNDTFELRTSIQKAVSLCKGYLANNIDDIDPILDRHGIDTFDTPREKFIASVMKIMEACKKDTNRVDFDDMIWFPNVHNLSLPKYDFVFVDEAQDLNKAQIELALNSRSVGGRVITVGDTKQAIYGFRGADSNAIPNIIERMNSKVLPLSVTYRCAKNIVDLAKVYVPQLEAAPNAEDGIVESISSKKIVDMVKPGDFILSRINAPLIAWCFELLKCGIPANIQGKDLGKNLLALIKKSKANDVSSFLDWLQDWKASEIERLTKLNRDTGYVDDRAECLITLCEGTTSISEVKTNVEKLFHDGDDKDRVMLSSTHKAKGLERDRVFLLHSTYKPGRTQEETNLMYVAITRARRELFLVKN